MKNNNPAYPSKTTKSTDKYSQVYKGLTKREYCAIKIMQGFATSMNVNDPYNETDRNYITKKAITFADQLLENLEK